METPWLSDTWEGHQNEDDDDDDDDVWGRGEPWHASEHSCVVFSLLS